MSLNVDNQKENHSEILVVEGTDLEMNAKQDMSSVKIVAVDGPAGSGKSTICKMVGEKLGWDYVNTGKLYRSIGFLAQEQGVALDDDDKLTEIAADFGEHFRWNAATDEIFDKARNLSEHLYSVEAGECLLL